MFNIFCIFAICIRKRVMCYVQKVCQKYYPKLKTNKVN